VSPAQVRIIAVKTTAQWRSQRGEGRPGAPHGASDLQHFNCGKNADRKKQRRTWLCLQNRIYATHKPKEWRGTANPRPH